MAAKARSRTSGAADGRSRPAAPGRPQQAAALIALIVVLLALVVAVVPRGAAGRPEAAGGGPAPAPDPQQPRPEAAPAVAHRPQPQQPRGTAAVAGRTVKPRPAVRGRLAVVIDDVGHNLDDLEPFLAIPGPLTFAILPGLPHSSEAARRAQRAGKSVIVHMPMEAIGGQNPGPGAIFVWHDDAAVRDRVERALESVPGARGMNNHMGSRAIADRRVMAAVMDTLADRGLFFLDSRTTADTVAREAAAERGVPFLERSVFLDNVAEAGEVEAQFARGEALALEKGSAILIGHVQNEATREVLARLLPSLPARGIEQATPESVLPP